MTGTKWGGFGDAPGGSIFPEEHGGPVVMGGGLVCAVSCHACGKSSGSLVLIRCPFRFEVHGDDLPVWHHEACAKECAGDV